MKVITVIYTAADELFMSGKKDNADGVIQCFQTHRFYSHKNRYGD